MKMKKNRKEDLMHKKFVKRMLDIILSFAGLVLSSWLFLIIIIAIEIDDPGPVFSVRNVSVHIKSISNCINSAV